jgi:hypothetical protein
MIKSRIRLYLRICLFASTLLLGGCTYVCHDYTFVEPAVDGGRWHVDGRVYRYRPEDHKPPGSWPHWKAEEEDRYKLILTPVAADTSYWDTGDVYIRNSRIAAGDYTITVSWLEIVDLVKTHRDRISPAGKAQPHLLEWGKTSFESDFFHIPLPVPDTLNVEFELELIDSGTGAVTETWKISTPAVIDRHRRWSIVDAIES